MGEQSTARLLVSDAPVSATTSVEWMRGRVLRLIVLGDRLSSHPGAAILEMYQIIEHRGPAKPAASHTENSRWPPVQHGHRHAYSRKWLAQEARARGRGTYHFWTCRFY